MQVLGERLKQLTGVHVPEDAWDESTLPEHLRMRLRVVDEKGRTLESGREVNPLRQRHAGGEAGQGHRLSGQTIEQGGLTRWDFGSVPATLDVQRGAIRYEGLSGAGQ